MYMLLTEASKNKALYLGTFDSEAVLLLCSNPCSCTSFIDKAVFPEHKNLVICISRLFLKSVLFNSSLAFIM